LAGNSLKTSPVTLQIYFWQPVYFRHGESTVFPSESKESRGHFVGIAEHVGHAMTFKVLADDLQKVLFHSAIRSTLTPGEQNLRVDPLGGEVSSIVKLSHDPAPLMPFDLGGSDPDSSLSDEHGTKSSQLLPSTVAPMYQVWSEFLTDVPE